MAPIQLATRPRPKRVPVLIGTPFAQSISPTCHTSASCYDAEPPSSCRANRYGAANDPRGSHCGAAAPDMDGYLDQMFQALRTEAGAKVLRFWAFQSFTGAFPFDHRFR
jgi:hypothetical protein